MRKGSDTHRHPLQELTLRLRTAGFLARRLWRPALYMAGARISRRR